MIIIPHKENGLNNSFLRKLVINNKSKKRIPVNMNNHDIIIPKLGKSFIKNLKMS